MRRNRKLFVSDSNSMTFRCSRFLFSGNPFAPVFFLLRNRSCPEIRLQLPWMPLFTLEFQMQLSQYQMLKIMLDQQDSWLQQPLETSWVLKTCRKFSLKENPSLTLCSCHWMKRQVNHLFFLHTIQLH